MHARTIALGLMCALALGELGVAGCSKPSTPSQPVSVSAAAVKRGDITSTFALTGAVTPAQQANLSSVVSGAVTQVPVQIGQRVRAGELLVQIDDSTLQAQLQQSEAALNAAQAKLAQTRANDVGNSSTSNANLQSAQVAYDTAAANLRRDQQLLAQGYVSQSALEQAQAQFSSAQAQLRAAQIAAQNANLGSNAESAGQADIKSSQAAVAQAAASVNFLQAQIAQSTVTAPFDGVVTQRNVDPGTLAAPNMTLVQVSQLDPIYVNVGVPDSQLAFVAPGKSVRISVSTIAGRSWPGRIKYLNAAASQGTLSYLARVAVANPDFALKAGMVADATFVQVTHRDVLLTPLAAVSQTEAGTVVFIVANGKAKEVPVSIGVETQAVAEISGKDIRPGTLIITQRPDSLQDGAPVSIVARQTNAT